MSEKEHLHLPDYEQFSETTAVLELNMSASLLHGAMCGYLCAGVDSQGEAYLRALLHNKKDEASRKAVLVMFAAFSISQQQINSLDFGFEMLLPHENEPLMIRIKAFGDWCRGFTESLKLAGINVERFHEEETQDAFNHLIEFAEIDCDTLDLDEGDERALMEVSEYTRMAVLRLYNDLVMNESSGSTGITH